MKSGDRAKRSYVVKEPLRALSWLRRGEATEAHFFLFQTYVKVGVAFPEMSFSTWPNCLSTAGNLHFPSDPRKLPQHSPKHGLTQTQFPLSARCWGGWELVSEDRQLCSKTIKAQLWKNINVHIKTYRKAKHNRDPAKLSNLAMTPRNTKYRLSPSGNT